MFMFDVAAGSSSEVLNFNSARHIETSRYEPAGTGLVALVPEAEGHPRALSRVVFRDNGWVAEEYPIPEDWIINRPFSWLTPWEGVVGFQQRGELRRISWPEGQRPALGEMFALANTALRQRALSDGTISISARGDHVLWDDPQGRQFEVERIGVRFTL
jgi:hypothetical protein